MIEKKEKQKVNLASWTESWPNNPSVHISRIFCGFLDTFQLNANNSIDTTSNSDPFDPTGSQLRDQTFPLTLGLYKPL